MRVLRQLSLTFLSTTFTFVLPLAAEMTSINIENVHFQVQTSAERIQLAVEEILSIPPDQQTFENTLSAWYDISKEIRATTSLLKDQMKADYLDEILAREAIQKYHSFVDTIYLHHPELYYSLFSYAKKALVDDSLNTPFQQYLAHLVGINCEQFKEIMSWDDQKTLAALLEMKSKIEKPYTQWTSVLTFREILSPDLYTFYKAHRIASAKDRITLCGELSAGAKSDTDGRSSADISISGKSDDGRLSGRVSGEINRDSDGNIKGSIEARGNWEFNR